MKPLSIAMLCAACCFGAAATSYLLFEFLHEPARTAPTPAVNEDIAEMPAPAPAQDPRVDALESEVRFLRDQVEVLKSRPAARFEEPGAAGQASGGEDETSPETELMAKLEQRLSEFESMGSSGRAMREGALIDLNNGNGRERREAAEMLGMLAKGGDESAKQALLDALKNDDPDIREDALEGISKSGLPEFLPALEAAMNDEHSGVRQEVAEALRDMPIDQAGPLLAGMLKDDNERVLLEAVDALGDAGYEPAREDIRPLTRHSNERVAVEAAIALRRTGDATVAEGWVPTLGARVNSDNGRESRNAVRQLRRMRVEAARPFLEQALESDNWRVRRDARRGLNELDESGGR